MKEMSLKKTFFLLLFLCGMAKSAYSQDSIRIIFDPVYHVCPDDGNGLMKLFSCNSNGAFFYNDSAYQVVFPDSFYATDTAIAFNYFTGWRSARIESTTAFLFGNYSGHQPMVYVDYNHNLDFRDDGLPVLFGSDSSAVIYLRNSEFPGSYFPIKFSYPALKTETKPQYEAMFTQMPPLMKGSKTLSIDHWLADQRMNYKTTDTRIGGKTFKITIEDYNCNGLFNDQGEDRIFIGNYETGVMCGDLNQGAVIFSDSAQLQLGEKIYEIASIDPSGQLVMLKISKRPYHKPLGIGEALSDLDIRLISGKTKSIGQLQEKNKFLLLDFWGAWCAGCTQQLPALKKFLENHVDKLQIIGLNYGDKPETIEKYLSKHRINWTNGYATNELVKKLRIDGFPSYLLLDPEGKIVLMGADLEEIEDELE